MEIKKIYSSSGEYVGFIEKNYYFSSNRKYLGWLKNGEVWGKDGIYRGYLYKNNYIVSLKYYSPPVPKKPKKPKFKPQKIKPPINKKPIVLPRNLVDVYWSE